MSVQSSTELLKKIYGDTHDQFDYLGMHNSKRVFGLISIDEIATVERPFYVLVDGGKTTEIEMPMIEDDAYYDSQFATIERKFKYFEEKKILD